MQLLVLESTADSVRAGYECPCGCRPSVKYDRAAAGVHDGCCCGNEFAVGPQATTALDAKPGYRAESTSFGAPWGETIAAAWLIGPSVHADESAHTHDHEAHDEGPQVATELDPVCGMTVDARAAEAKGLRSTYKEHDYYFCGRGCKLDFDEDPERYLDPSYTPSM